MMLTKPFFIWPYDGSIGRASAEVAQAIQRADLAAFRGDSSEAGDLAEFICLVCRMFNVSPWWVLVSGEREQSAWTKNPLMLHDKREIMGFVGQDSGHVNLPGYYGIYAQVYRCIEQTAWLLGEEPKDKWPGYYRLKKTVERYSGPFALPVKDLNGNSISYGINDAGIYVQLAYTPHLPVLAANQLYANKLVPAQYIPPTPPQGP